jgi:hypothetical protein
VLSDQIGAGAYDGSDRKTSGNTDIALLSRPRRAFKEGQGAGKPRPLADSPNPALTSSAASEKINCWFDFFC